MKDKTGLDTRFVSKIDTIIRHTKLSYSTQDDVIGEMLFTQTDLDARKFGYFRFCTVIFRLFACHFINSNTVFFHRS